MTLGAIRKSRHDESQALEQANLLEAQINELKAQQLQLESQQLQAQQRAAAEKGKREGIRVERHLQLDSRKEERTKYSGVALTVDATPTGINTPSEGMSASPPSSSDLLAIVGQGKKRALLGGSGIGGSGVAGRPRIGGSGVGGSGVGGSGIRGSGGSGKVGSS